MAHGVRDHPHLSLAMPSQPPDPTPAPAAPAGTLRHLLRASPRLAPDHAARLLAAMARALAAWHARGGTHGGAYGALAPERVLVAPGEFYGPRGARHVRAALTVSDERLTLLADRLT